MQFEIPEQEAKQAQVPHEIFLTNLIGNHILLFIATLGIVKVAWQPLAMVPVISFCLLFYTLWRARKSRQTSPWFVMCHWQIAARRSWIFIAMLALMLLVSALGWLGYAYLGMMKVAVYAIVGGVGILPTMVTILVLIVMESESMYLAKQNKLPEGIVKRFPNADAKVIVEQV